jgi:hypothetical protein
MKPDSKSLWWWLVLLAGCHSLTYVPREAGEAGSGDDIVRCVDSEYCVRGQHWDEDACECVPNEKPDAGAPRDAGGPACVDSQLCARGLRWDREQCACVPDAGGGGSGGAMDEDAGPQCVEDQLCVIGRHWDRSACACVLDAPAGGSGGAAGEGGSGAVAADGGSGGAAGSAPCVDNQACIQGLHWDSSACTCVPDDATCGDATCSPQERCCQVADPSDGTCVPRCESVCPGQPCLAPQPDAGAADSCEHASDCMGPLPHLCQVCGGLDDSLNPASGCAHWACRSKRCELAFCD